MICAVLMLGLAASADGGVTATNIPGDRVGGDKLAPTGGSMAVKAGTFNDNSDRRTQSNTFNFNTQPPAGSGTKSPPCPSRDQLFNDAYPPASQHCWDERREVILGSGPSSHAGTQPMITAFAQRTDAYNSVVHMAANIEKYRGDCRKKKLADENCPEMNEQLPQYWHAVMNLRRLIDTGQGVPMDPSPPPHQ